MKETPEILDKIVDVVLAYRPKPKTKAAKKRKRKKTALEKEKPTSAVGFLFGGNDGTYRNGALHDWSFGGRCVWRTSYQND